MDVILTKDVEKVGLRGEVVSVARGYARNFLFPRKLAEEATPARVAELQKRESNRARQEAKTAEQAQSIAETLTKTVLRFEVKAGPTGSLFGSVTPTDIADEIWRTRKIRVDRRKIGIDNIKRIGNHTVPIDLFEGVRVEVRRSWLPRAARCRPTRSSRRWRRPSARSRKPLRPRRPSRWSTGTSTRPSGRAPRMPHSRPTARPRRRTGNASRTTPDEPEWRADADAALRDEA